MHTAKQEKCQILWMGPFNGIDPSWDWKNFWMHFRVYDQKLWNGPPRIWHLVEILPVHVQSNDACKFAINLFPISWGPVEDVHLLYFLLKMPIWNGCNVLNLVGNPIKDINVNLSFLSSRWKVVEWTPPGSDIWWKFWKFYFPCTVQWCMQICNKPFSHQLRVIWRCSFTLFSIENADLKWL